MFGSKSSSVSSVPGHGVLVQLQEHLTSVNISDSNKAFWLSYLNMSPVMSLTGYYFSLWFITLESPGPLLQHEQTGPLLVLVLFGGCDLGGQIGRVLKEAHQRLLGQQGR